MLFRDFVLYYIKALALRALFVAFISTCLPIASATADPDQELKKLREQLSASNERQEEISGRLRLLSGEISALKQKLSQAALRVRDLDQRMLDTEDRLEDIAAVEKQTLRILSEQNAGLADTLSALLQLSRQPEGSLIGSPENLIDTLRAATLLKSVIPSLKAQADELAGQLDALAELRDEHLAERQKFAELRKSRQSEQETLDELIAAKRSAQIALRGANSQENRKQRQLSSRAENLVALLGKLAADKRQRLAQERARIEAEIQRQEQLRREEEERKQEEMRALAADKQRELAEKAEKNTTETTVIVPTPPPSRKSDVANQAPQTAPNQTQVASLPQIGAGRPFSKIKGTLPLPVGGRIISNYNSTRKRSQRSGIEIETRDGAAVVSPYDGQIAFAGPFRHYGLLLIIDHGEGYHTLLAGMGRIDGDVGQLLLAGEPVGTMKSENNVKPTLYMELRVKGSPVNPIPWLAAGYRKVSG